MKKFFKRYWLLLALGVFGTGLFAASNDFTDFWTIKGRGSLNGTSIWWIDTNRDLNSYDGNLTIGLTGDLQTNQGDLKLGTGDTRPTTTSETYPGVLVPIYNGFSSSMTEGDVVIASVTSSTSGYGTLGTAIATTTILGVAAETITSGSVGFMRVSGYAIVKATGVVNMGDIMVSTNVAGYSGHLTAAGTSDLVGSVIGKAMSTQAAATSGSVLVLLNR